jgi:hypothetical protein
METKFAIGCLVQWYECDIIGEYIESLRDAIDAYDGKVIVDIDIITNEDLEKPISNEKKWECIDTITNLIGTPASDTWNVNVIGHLHTIADYRREFNNNYCDDVDVLVWGESDAILPKQMFVVLDSLHHMSLQNNNPKYLAFFGICKMWDNTWKQLEHPEFTDKPFIENDYDNWWSLKYTMSKKEMDKINNKTEELDVQVVSPHKFNGCGLVISSEVIKAGVNIPKSVFFVHEDSAFMWMTNKVLGNIPQYIIKNILLVHNRNHPEKRNYIKGEYGGSMNAKRRSNDWYVKANKMCEQNYLNMFNPNYKSFTWKDIW